MSPPTRQLGKLSLGENMPTTRSQAHRRNLRSPPVSVDSSAAAVRHSPHAIQKQEGEGKRGRGKGREKRPYHQQQQQHQRHPSESNSDKQDSNNDDSDESTPSDAIASMVLAAKSRIVYDIESLEMESRARALAGLTGQFDVVYCRETSPFYEFQLIERPRIRIRDGGGAECTCAEYGNRPDMACRHIFWLVDQVYDSISPSAPPPGLPLSREGFSPKLPPLHTILNEGLESLATHLEWPFIPGNESCARPGGRRGEEACLSRQEQVRDIMSAFNKVTLPEDFRTDLVETGTSSSSTTTTPEQCVVQGDFEATIFRLAIHDDHVYSSIRKAMPAGACAAIYFDKVQQQSRNLLLHFDEYRRTGRLPRGRRTLEVREVAKQLRSHVAKIRRNLAVRIPYGTKGAVEALITLLQDISARNIDAFENNSWGRIAPAREDDDDRNLYEQLIGQAGSNSSSNNNNNNNDEADQGEDLFVLDVLSEVPAAVLESYLPTLFEILAKVEINRAPAAFVLKLKSLIQDAQSSQGAAATRAKRPAAVEAGGSLKRTR